MNPIITNANPPAIDLHSMPPGTPREFDEYRTLAHLGSGSYGHVYRVEKPASESLALKWLRADSERQGHLRFENEKWALKKLDHKSIPKILDEGLFLGRPYSVMTLARGAPLNKLYEDNLRDQGPCGQMLVLSIIIGVLDALSHAHSKGIYHRDVKLDNIVANRSLSNLMLIDFGVCRAQDQPTEPVTFWNIGASRYSPPEKLRHPSLVHPTHDVFAVGVVAYLLLTNRYPWAVSETEDSGHLEQLMRSTRARPISEINSFVSNEVAAFVESLLAITDDDRPDAPRALAAATDIRKRIANRIAPPVIVKEKNISFPRVIRDPVHGDIRMTDAEWKILDSPEIQRLRWIKQLGFTHLVFPGAEHTRLSHALGTMHIADKILRNIEDATGVPFAVEERLMARTYALVHDIAHIPYGHTLEDELRLFEPHDQNQARIRRFFLSDKSRVSTILRSTDYGRAVLAHFDQESSVTRHTFIKELITGPVGADVLDYIDRDSYFCGLDHRIDSAIFRRYKVVATTETGHEGAHCAYQVYGKHGRRIDADFELETIPLQRFCLYMKVYTHPKKVSASAMLGKALVEAVFRPKQPLGEKEIERMGDSELLLSLRDKGGLCRDLSDMLLVRSLYSVVYLAHPLKSQQRSQSQYEARRAQFGQRNLLTPEGRMAQETRLADLANLKKGEVIIYCPYSPPGFDKIQQYIARSPGEIERRDEVHSQFHQTVERHLGLWCVYVFAPKSVEADKRARLADASASLFEIPNEIVGDLQGTFALT